MSNPARRICLRVLDSIGGSGLAVIRSLENFYGIHLEMNGEDVLLTENDSPPDANGSWVPKERRSKIAFGILDLA